MTNRQSKTGQEQIGRPQGIAPTSTGETPSLALPRWVRGRSEGFLGELGERQKYLTQSEGFKLLHPAGLRAEGRFCPQAGGGWEGGIVGRQIKGAPSLALPRWVRERLEEFL